MNIPTNIRDRIRDHIWGVAEKIDWSNISDASKAKYYELWTRDPEIGGKLGHFMDPRKIRVYIKDSLLKPFEREKILLIEKSVLESVSILPTTPLKKSFIKPHGKLFSDGKLVCWGKSRDWKAVVMAVFERAHLAKSAIPYAVVLIETGNTVDEKSKKLVRTASDLLQIQHIHWIAS